MFAQVKQVNRCVAWRGGAVCKTVGSAYVGSNPTPASLRRLALDGNRLTTLPRELADLLSGGLELGLAGNPLQGPILELYGQGPQALAFYLRGLE
jgi:Leucine-rich repeat (LRR) protein